MPEITVWTKQNRAVLDQLEANGRFIADEYFIRRELEDTADIMLFIYMIFILFYKNIFLFIL